MTKVLIQIKAELRDDDDSFVADATAYPVPDKELKTIINEYYDDDERYSHLLNYGRITVSEVTL